MSNFKLHALNPILNNYESSVKPGLILRSNKLARFIGNLEEEQIIMIGGREQAGKTSFADFIYLIGLFFDNYYTNKKCDFKFIYFGMKHSLKYKMQKWLCLYLKLQHSRVIDIPTLNGTNAKMYNLDKEIINDIKLAEHFFQEFEKHITFIDKPLQPTNILNIIKKEMESIGHIDENNIYVYDENHKNTKVFVHIQTTDYLLPELSNKDGVLESNGLEKKLADILIKIKKEYKITSIIVKTNNRNTPRNIKESEPSFKDLGVLYETADVGIILYSPWDFGNKNYLNFPVSRMVVNGKNRLRTITVVRNIMGSANNTFGLIFLGECGYFTDAPRTDEEEVWTNLEETLSSI